MKNYQFYRKDGTLFIFKNQPVFIFILAILMFIAAGMVYKIRLPLLGVVLIAFGVLIIVNFFAKKLVIDTVQKTVTGKHSIFVPAKTYSFADFTGFRVVAMKYMGFITTNVMLAIHFNVNGKEEKLTIGQALTHKGIQKMVNETEDIMSLNENIR
ncbi:hypothetical protein ACM46_22520 [Chryseobacterium angstadtii]|uniref:DUF304 domain-containing protein n=1 Tax=Chryseobacterium angstadtii TaxID=558151 RepID=A0A0J7HY51_9FLAO|nr:hypothetical protein [Chryseobacterium angstadtii]KMQ58476.1 hypothetical protein ACM46_22520 [Chryseobacterium angstadtii]